jgi:hypothetical protein
MDCSGKIILQADDIGNEGELEISGVADGLYLLRVSTSQTNEIKKILIKH